MKELKVYGITAVCAILAAFLIRIFLVEAYRIPTAAMKPTLIPGDVIFVAKWPFGVFSRPPRLGEVVLYTLPDEPDRHYLKRVVALGGAQVWLRGGHLTVDGHTLELKAESGSPCGHEVLGTVNYPVCVESPVLEDAGPIDVPRDSVFVIGDFRQKSETTRAWSVVPTRLLSAKAIGIWLSVDPTHPGWWPAFRWQRFLNSIRP
ncbi:MAG: signal peptidase I [Bacteriovoracia bacterium]